MGSGRGTYAGCPAADEPCEPGAGSAASARTPQAPLPAAASDAAVRSTARRDSAFSSTSPGFVSRETFLAFVRIVVLPLALSLLPSEVFARHIARLDPTEPIFTQRCFLENEIELDSEWDHGGGNQLTLTAGFAWIVMDGLELDLDVPAAISWPDDGPTVGSLGDLGFAGQWLFYGSPEEILDYASLRVEIDAPTGNRSKDIGGTGAWSVSLLPGRSFTIAEDLSDLLVQLELGYAQNFALDVEEAAAAEALGRPRRVEKQLVWNLALAQSYWLGRIRPVLEVLGTTVVDDADPAREDTIVELAAGVWTAPFFDEHWLAPVSIGLGFNFPVTSAKESDVTGLLIVQWSFDP